MNMHLSGQWLYLIGESLILLFAVIFSLRRIIHRLTYHNPHPEVDLSHLFHRRSQHAYRFVFVTQHIRGILFTYESDPDETGDRSHSLYSRCDGFVPISILSRAPQPQEATDRLARPTWNPITEN